MSGINIRTIYLHESYTTILLHDIVIYTNNDYTTEVHAKNYNRNYPNKPEACGRLKHYADLSRYNCATFARDRSLRMISSYETYTHAHARFEKSRKARRNKYIAGGLGYCVVRTCKSNLPLRAITDQFYTKQTISVPSETFTKRDTAFLKKDRSRVNMALVSRDLFRNWWQDMDLYHRELEDHFRRLSTRGDIWQPPPMPSFDECFRPWKTMMEQLQHQVGGSTTVEREQDKYQVIVDMQHFAPEEITVRTDDKYITIEAKHEEKKDQHGYVSRHFVRRYTLPQGYDMGHVRPSLSCDGVLTVTAPRLVLPAPGERIVPIERMNTPALKAA